MVDQFVREWLRQVGAGYAHLHIQRLPIRADAVSVDSLASFYFKCPFQVVIFPDRADFKLLPVISRPVNWRAVKWRLQRWMMVGCDTYFRLVKGDGDLLIGDIVLCSYLRSVLLARLLALLASGFVRTLIHGGIVPATSVRLNVQFKA